MIQILIVGALCWLILSVIAAPLIGAAIAGRVMSRAEKDALSWGVLALFCALFFLATLVIGTR